MRRHCLALCFTLALTACKGGDETPPDGGVKPDGGSEQNSPFAKLTLDETASDLLPLSLAVGPGDVVGIAYFFRVTPTSPDYEIRYLQVSGGMASPAEKVATVQRVYGLSLAFDSSGRPAVAYLGGASDQSTFWFQSDMAVSFRTGANQWTESIAVTDGQRGPSRATR